MTPGRTAIRYANTDATPPWAPAGDAPRIGADESAKGDYFGPLVSAAVYVDERAAERLASIGVQDSKRLTDGRLRALAPQVREAQEIPNLDHDIMIAY
jgi:ribonuclease HIII